VTATTAEEFEAERPRLLGLGVSRIEAIFDAGYPGWRDREAWRRQAVVSEASGALDLPGSTWRDRPAIQQEPAGCRHTQHVN
jgi:hypothetical protein